MMRKKVTLLDIPAKIVADTCGTAAQKTITVRVNSEMSLDTARHFINELDNIHEWLSKAPRACEACDHYEDCGEGE